MRDPTAATDRTSDRQGRTLSAETAAAMLGTTPATLKLWEERFAFPVPVASVDGRPRYSIAAVLALRDAFDRELSLAGAIEEAQRAL